MFHRNNLNKKGFASSGNESKQPADGWESPRAISDIQWAIANLAEVFANLWPLDGSIRVLQRVLIRYDYGAGYGSSEKDRCRILEDFIDRILCENASRAARGTTYIGYETAKNRWRDAVEKEPMYKAPSEPQRAPAMTGMTGQSSKADGTGTFSASAGSRGGGRGRTGARGNLRGGWQARNAVAEFQGNPVCFHFNNKPIAGKQTGCTRPLAGGGCDNGRGGVYAHVCNHHFGNGNFCLQPHTRFGNH